MLCRNCGTDNPDIAKFCKTCGCPLDQAEPSQPSVENTVPQQAAYEEPEQAPVAPDNYYSPAQDSYNPAFNTTVPETPTKPKKKHKFLKAVAIILGVFVVLGGVLFACKDYIIKAAVGDTTYYIYSEAMTLKELFSDKDFGPLLKNKQASIDANGKISVDGVDVSASLKGSYNTKNGQSTFDTKVKASGQKVGVKVNTGNKKVGISVPDLTDEILTISLENGIKTSKMVDLAKNTYPIIQKVEKKNKDKIKTGKEKIDGKTLNTITYTFTDEDLYKIEIDFLEELKDNKKFQKAVKEVIKDNADLIDKISELSGEDIDIEEAFDDLIDEIPDAIDDINEYIDERKDSPEYYSTSTYTYKIAYRSSHQIYQRVLNIKYESENYKREATVTITTDIGKKATHFKIAGEFSYTYDGETEKNKSELINYSKTKANGKTAIKISVYDGEFVIKSSDLDVEKVHGVYVPTGKITFKGDTSYLGELSGSITMSAGDSFTAKIDVEEDDEDLFGLKITADLSNKPDFSDYEEPDNSGSDDIAEFYEDIMESIYGSAYRASDYGDYDDDYYGYDDYDYSYDSDYDDYDYSYDSDYDDYDAYGDY